MLVDFGIAKLYDPTLKTATGAQAVTTGYSPPEQYAGGSSERPVHEVFLDDYYIDILEVTNENYAACVAENHCQPQDNTSSYSRSSYYNSQDFTNYPVIFVSWNDARSYCNWRGARLPTEAEWEKAARGGLKGKHYPWGDEFDGNLLNFCDRNCPFDDIAEKNYDDGYADTSPVGSYEPNGYGLYDMVGNVWEWVADWYDENYYENSLDENPQGPTASQFVVLRGGSWSYYKNGSRTSFRLGLNPLESYSGVGFRCAVSP